MSSAIHIGNNFDEKSMENVAGAVEKIFKAGHDNRMDQATVQKALDVFGRVGQVTGAAVHGCHFEMAPEARGPAIHLHAGAVPGDFPDGHPPVRERYGSDQDYLDALNVYNERKED